MRNVDPNLVRQDSIIASQPLVVEFCNKIGPTRTFRDVRFPPLSDPKTWVTERT